MPGNQHLPGASPVRQRMYEHIKKSELSRGRSAQDAKRIAAATTNKYRAEHGETEDRAKFALNDRRHWMNPGGHSIVKHPGKLHRDLGIPQGQKIPAGRLEAATHSKSPSVRREANLAEVFKHSNHHHK